MDEIEKVKEIILGVLGPESVVPEGSFRDPETHLEKGERYGLESVLVVIHDGGPLAPYFNFSYEQYERMERMSEALEAIGYYPEQCTGWYSAIYKS